MLRFLIISLLCCSYNFVECYHLCSATNLSCSYQLWGDKTEDACQMLYYPRNTLACQDELPEKPKRNPPQKGLGLIQIIPFVAENESRTVFKLTAFNISWTNFKFRFKQRNTQEKCTKREFIIKDLVPRDKFLIYDCPWSSSAYEDKILDFEYSIGVDNIYETKSTFLVHVPKSELIKYYYTNNLRNLQLFTYVETTNLYHLVYKIHIVSQIDISDYEIYVNFTKNNSTRTDGPFVKDARSALLGVLDFEYDTFGVPGEYYFYVRPFDCTKCGFSISPTVVIPETSVIVTIGIVSMTCLIPILILAVYINFKVENGFTPRVLLVTTPANNAHKTIGTTLSKLLKEKHNIETMMDITDIKTTKIVPTEWLKKSFDYATHIVILASDDKPPTSIYRNMDQSLYRLLETNPKKTCCIIKFPFTKPPKLNFTYHRSFQLMRDYTDFINFLKKRGYLHQLKDKLFKNNLFNELIEQINNYSNNVIIVNKPKFSVDYSENEKDEISDAKSEVEESEDVPVKYREIAQEFAQSYAINCDNSDTEEITPHPDVLALLQQ